MRISIFFRGAEVVVATSVFVGRNVKDVGFKRCEVIFAPL